MPDPLDLFYRQIGSSIRQHREALRWSQDRLARAVGLSRASLSNIEVGRQRPPLDVYYRLAEQMKVDIWKVLPARLHMQVDIEEAVAGVEQLHDQDLKAFEDLVYDLFGGEDEEDDDLEEASHGGSSSFTG